MAIPPRARRHKPKQSTPEPERSFALLRDALAKGDHASACTTFERLYATRWIPRRPDVVPWLSRELGARATNLLVSAFAQHPCHFCLGEWLPCMECDGACEDERGRTCKSCSGLALACCAACAGAGLINYAAVPVGLRHAVLKHRIAESVKLVRSVKPGTGTGAQLKASARLAMVLRARAVLANALGAAAEHAPGINAVRESIPNVTRQRVIRLSKRLSADSQRALRLLLTEMADAQKRISDRGGQSAADASRRAASLRSLAESKRFTSPLLWQSELDSTR